jgi:hypothetical protein
MPLLVTYCGRRVKRRRRVGQHLQLRFYAQSPGHSGPVVLVSQPEWERHGRIEVLPAKSVAT